MKKEALILTILLVILIYSTSFAIAVACTDDSDCGDNEICIEKVCEKNNSAAEITSGSNEDTKIDKAYQCLENKVKDKCSSLSSEEKVFSLLAIEKCKDEVISDSKYKSDLKYTAQAIFALDKVSASTDDAENWLFTQKAISEEVVWYLQIESNEATSCTITYLPDTIKNSITIGEDKKINSNAGTCLSLSEGNYWLRVDPSCYEKEFEISCNKGFQTNLLFKKKTSSTIYVSEKTTSASAEGKTTEKINSVCFSKAGKCDYEGSLWAAIALDFKGNNVYDYVPYLITMAEENKNFIPNSFLYYLIGSGDFRSQILLQQKENKYWDESGDKFYDTALALFPFSDDPSQKTNSKNWLLEVQDSDGCWQGNIRNTAFLLNSIWPRDLSIAVDDTEDCEDSNFFCMSRINCEGNVLDDYDCSGALICCDSKKELETCSEQNGKPCASGEICSGGNLVDSFDLGTAKCCVGGECKVQEQESECVSNSGECRPYGCESNEETAPYDCDYQEYTCCVQKTTEAKSYWWIWLLVILIVLVLIAIIFRNKLRPYWFRIKSKFGKGSPPQRAPPRPGLPPPSSRIPLFNPSARRILPPSQPMQRRLPQKSPGEIDNILKKLKEMGK